MKENETGKSVFDIGVEIADEIENDDLRDGLRHIRDHQSLQKARAQAVLQELTSGLPDKPNQDDGNDYLDYVTDRLNKVIAVNLDANSIYEFVFLAGNFRDRLRAATTTKRASNGKRLSGATARTKIRKEELAKLEAENRAMLSAAGVLGGKARSAGYEPIKRWALERASKMRGEPKQIARQLRAILPRHFADISLDPERLIYDTLRSELIRIASLP